MEDRPLDDAIRRSAESADGERAQAAARLEAQERAAQAAETARQELFSLTRDFLTRMASAGHPCLRDRRRWSSHTRVAGWDLRDGSARYGESPYRVIAADGSWWHYDPYWDHERHPDTPPASLRQEDPSVDEAAKLLAEALVGYGATDPKDQGYKALSMCTDVSAVAAVIERDGHMLYREAAAAAWVRILDGPGIPAPTHDMIEVHGRGWFLGAWRFRTSGRSRAWSAGTSYDNRRVWLDEHGLERIESEERWASLPSDRRNAPILAIVAPGDRFRATRGTGVRPLNAVVLDGGSRPTGSVSAIRTVLASP